MDEIDNKRIKGSPFKHFHHLKPNLIDKLTSKNRPSPQVEQMFGKAPKIEKIPARQRSNLNHPGLAISKSERSESDTDMVKTPLIDH